MRKQTLSVGLLALLAPCAMGQATLTGIETSKAGDGLQIVIQGEGLSNPKTLRVMGNTSFIVEFDCNLVGHPQTVKVGESGIKYVQYGWYKAKPPKCRVHVKSDSAFEPKLVQLNNNWVILVGNTGLEGTPNETTSVSQVAREDRALMESAIKQLTGQDLEITPNTTNPTPQAPVSSKSELLPAIPKVNSGSPISASLATDLEPKVASKTAESPTVPRTQKRGDSVSLDFVSTDVVQILKALSIQAGVNIVSSPEVSPSDKPLKLSISLNNVALEDALSYVTAMANLRYARVGNTFVVTPSASFSTAMRQIMERNASSYQTRVVNLMSGEASKIKEATLKALPPDGRNGYYELIVPGQNEAPVTSVGSTEQPVSGQGTGEAKGDPAQDKMPQTQPTAQSKSAGRAYYVMIVGDPTRLNDIEAYIHELDVRIAASFSLSRSQSTGTVAVPIQSGQTEKIKGMIEKLLSDNPRSYDYSITETSVKELEVGEQSTKFLLMIGPAGELETLKSFAIALDRELCKPLGIQYLDDTAQMVKDYEVVNLMFIEPVIAAQDLKGRFKDLWVTVVPDAATPGLKGEGESKKDEAPQDSGNGGATKTDGQKSELKKELGREPMKLILRGSKTTIEEAKRYLAMVDVAPKQIAIELRVLEMTKEDAFKMGIDWSILAGGRANLWRMNQGVGGTSSDPGVINGTTNFGQKTDGVTGKPFFENVSVLAQLDKVTNDRNLIARPNALVSHGREANLFVGDTIRYVKQIQSSQNGITVITDELQVGSTFNIKAKIGDKGNIALDLAQNFSILTGFTAVPGGGNLPQTSDRHSNMFVNMVSGETIAIGGLILDNDRKQYGGIPGLKDLPIIGKLFGRTNNLKTRTEIVFFLTAVEVDGSNRATAASPANSVKNAPDPIKEYKAGKVSKN